MKSLAEQRNEELLKKVVAAEIAQEIGKGVHKAVVDAADPYVHSCIDRLAPFVAVPLTFALIYYFFRWLFQYTWWVFNYCVMGLGVIMAIVLGLMFVQEGCKMCNFSGSGDKDKK